MSSPGRATFSPSIRSDPSPSGGRLGGGRVGDPRVTRVHKGGSSGAAGGAVEAVVSLAWFLLQACALPGGGARGAPGRRASFSGTRGSVDPRRALFPCQIQWRPPSWRGNWSELGARRDPRLPPTTATTATPARWSRWVRGALAPAVHRFKLRRGAADGHGGVFYRANSSLAVASWRWSPSSSSPAWLAISVLLVSFLPSSLCCSSLFQFCVPCMWMIGE